MHYPNSHQKYFPTIKSTITLQIRMNALQSDPICGKKKSKLDTYIIGLFYAVLSLNSAIL